MLSDRHYMREQPRFSPWSWCAILMVVLLVSYVVQAFLEFHVGRTNDILTYLALNDLALRYLYLWQFVTYMFLHGGLYHVLINLLCLFFFGRAVEHLLGRKNFLLIYFSSGILGGLLQVSLGLVFPQYYGGPVVGASAGVCGLLAAFCLVEPHATILLFFVIPVRARYILYFSLFVAGFFTLIPTDPGVAHAAHLGGLLTGMAYLYWGFHAREFRFNFNFNFLRRRKYSGQKITPVNFGSGGGSPAAPPEDFMSEEVDPILDKINKQGIQSLTERERKILEAARKKMDRK